MKSKQIPSPDLRDTICMAFLEGAHYLPADELTIAAPGATALEAARKEAQDAFADA